MKAERFLTDTMILGEGPIYDEAARILHWVDITAGQWWQHDFGSGQTSHHDLGERVGMCAVVRGGGMLMALEHSLVILKDGKRHVVLDGIEADKPDNRFNDGKCDAKGRLIAGTMDTKGRKEQGSLYSLDTKAGSGLKTLATDITTSNGIGFSPDNRHMYYIDTPSGFLWRFDYDLESGEATNRQAFIDYRQEPGRFDGMTVDAEGHLWVAHWGGYQISRWDRATGRKIGQIDLPAPLVTSCCFGGDDLSLLYITSAWNNDAKIKEEDPLAGALFVVQTDTVGIRAAKFAG